MPAVLAAQIDAFVHSADLSPAGESSRTQDLIDVGLKLFEMVRDRGNRSDLRDDEGRALHTLAAALAPVFESILRRARDEPGLHGVDALADAWREIVPAQQFSYDRLMRAATASPSRPPAGARFVTAAEVRDGLQRRRVAGATTVKVAIKRRPHARSST